MPDPSDRERREPDEDEGLSDLAKGYRTADRYVGAAITLVVSVGALTYLGHWLDERWQHQTPWLTLLGVAVGMTGGFISFFRTVLGKRK
ncbi:MAG TPA: AtpZ/AtpI family protein [Anaeromyxobacteraceae bacterium]|nr:AtpZ/AtpI family protein [Anaeromyxobacteraceae bacterium]